MTKNFAEQSGSKMIEEEKNNTFLNYIKAIQQKNDRIVFFVINLN